MSHESADLSHGLRAELSPEIEGILRNSGWRPEQDRSVEIAAWIAQLDGQFSTFDRLWPVLRRYGGLEVKLNGPGETWSRQSFRIDPTLALGEDDRFSDFENMSGLHLFPLGEVGHDAFLALGDNGHVYAIMLDMWLVGKSVEEAIENLIRGRAGILLIDEGKYREWVESESD